MRVPVAALSLLTSAVIVVDQWLGAPASFTNFFGYSPLLAARFYGMGNEAAAILFGSSIVGIALLFDQWPDSRWTTLGKRVGIPLLAVVVLSAAAAPFWGANIGVAIWGVVGFGLAWVLMNGHHVSGKTVLWLFVAVVAVIFAFAAIDLFGGGPQTHLGRAITSAEQGGWIELWNIVARKAETNMRVLTHTNWAYILVATLAFLGFMRWRPQGDFAGTLAENPDFADAITVSLVAGLVAYFTEDSGIVIPALEVFYVGVGVVWLMLARLRPHRAPKKAEQGRALSTRGRVWSELDTGRRDRRYLRPARRDRPLGHAGDARPVARSVREGIGGQLPRPPRVLRAGHRVARVGRVRDRGRRGRVELSSAAVRCSRR